MVGKLKKVIIATSLFAVLLNAEGTSEEGGASTSATSEKVTVREEKSSPKFEVKREEIHSKKKESGSSKIHEKQKKTIKKSENYSSKSHKSAVKNENIENNEVENNEIIISRVSSKPVNETANKILNDKKAKELNKKRAQIDSKKPVVKAVEKENEGESQYTGNLIQFVATTDGEVLKKEEETKKHPIASLTKVMNILVVLDQVDKGNAKLSDKVCFTSDTVNTGGSWLNAQPGDCYALKDLLRAEIIYSANNAAYLAASHIGKGNLDNFVKLMNKKAQELGMKNTEFHTPAGLPTSITKKGMDMSTAYDVYLLAKAAVKDKRISEWASEEELVLMNPRGEQVVYNNRNHLLDKYGIYGLKTGFHAQAGYNMMVASKMGNLDIISVSLGSKSDLDRTKDQETEFIDIKKKTKMIYKEGQEMSKFKVKNVKKKQIKGILSENVYQLSNTTDYKFRVKDLETVAGKDGIKKGDVIGKLEVLSKGRVVENVDILAEEDSKALTLFEKVLRTVTFGLI